MKTGYQGEARGGRRVTRQSAATVVSCVCLMVQSAAGAESPPTNRWALAKQGDLPPATAFKVIECGIVSISQTGRFYVASQDIPDEAEQEIYLSAVYIGRGNVGIRGCGSENTTLVAHNRATTIFYLGAGANHVRSPVTNVAIESLTMEGSPHWMYDLGYPNERRWEPGWLRPGTNDNQGTLLLARGIDDQRPARNILVRQCTLKNPSFNAISVPACALNVLCQSNDFLFRADGTNGAAPVLPVTTNTVTTGVAMGDVGLMVRAGPPLDNINIVDCTFNGEPGLTNVCAADSADGLVWCQWTGGNWYAARNTLTNYSLEALQFNSGPAAAVQNRFFTYASHAATCALACSMYPPATGPSAEPPDLAVSFVGNEVVGGRNGLLSRTYALNPATNITRVLVSGNRLELYPAYQVEGDDTGAAAWIWRAEKIDLTGNTLVAGDAGLRVGYGMTNAVVLKNDFGVAAKISLDNQAPPGWAVSSQSVANKLGCGVTFHVRGAMGEGATQFLYRNDFVNSTNGPAALFCEPLALPVHCQP